MTDKPGWGAVRSIPEGVESAWGARLIWPDDLVWDRQDMTGDERQRSDLGAWLNGGALKAALEVARLLAGDHKLRPSDDTTVTLYKDERGTVVANPQGSHGYLYVAAWLKP